MTRYSLRSENPGMSQPSRGLVLLVRHVAPTLEFRATHLWAVLLRLDADRGAPAQSAIMRRTCCSSTFHQRKPARVPRTSFDHLISADQEGGGYLNSESLGGLQVDDQLYLSGLLDGQLSGPLAIEDPPNIGAKQAIAFG